MLAKATVGEIVRYGASFKSVAALSANTPENIWAAASNIAGVIVWAAGFVSHGNAETFDLMSLVCKATAPGSVVDGVVVLAASCGAVTNTTSKNNGLFGQLPRPVFVPAGLRGDFIRNTAENTGMRYCNYTIL